MKKLGVIIISLLFHFVSSGQIDTVKYIQVSEYINGEKVLLRWAPYNYSSWERGNKYGYSIYRIPIIKDGKIINNPDTILVGNCLPKPLDHWQNFEDSSTFAIAAEAIYGSEFEVTTQANNFYDIINKSKEQDNRFSMGLLCADQSYTVACMMGLGFVDSTADTNFSYVYKVVANYADSVEKHEVGYVFVDFNVENFIPKPFGISHYVNKGRVTITLPFEPFKGIYTNFELERSSDKVKFSTVVGKRYYSMSTTEDDPKYSIYNDSVKQEVATYYYRMRGVTPFDTYGPYSDTIDVDIMPTIESKPWITDIREVDNKLLVEWDLEDSSCTNLNGFMVYSATDHNGPFKPVFSENLGKNSRQANIQKPNDFSYYKIAAIDQFNRSYFSLPRLFQEVDSIPPLPPTGLKGEFDSTGTVNLKWNYSNEPDVLGYQLLYTVNSNSEYTLIDKGFIYDSTYTTKFPLDVLSSKLYFEIVALDTRYNTSKASNPIMLVKPDTIPPSPPLLVIETDSLGNAIAKVSPSNSNDIAKHIIYFENSSNSSPVEVFNGKISSDTSIVLNSTNSSGILYCIAVDITGRKGVSAKIPFYTDKENKSVSVNIKSKILIDDGCILLSWDSARTRGDVLIYRKVENGNYNLIATVDNDYKSFTDKDVIINTNYTYRFIFKSINDELYSRLVLLRYK